MEQAERGSLSVSGSLSFIASEDALPSDTDIEAQTLGDGESLLKCFSPLFNSMRLFGLYFTQASRRIHDASTSTAVTTDSRKWNGGRIYAVVIMVVAWLSVVRMFSVFDKTEKFGYALFLKFTIVSSALFGAFLNTACYVSCQTGNLDRVFLDARLPKSDIARYRRLAVIHTIVLWVLMVVDVLVFLVPLFSFDSDLSLSMTPIGVHVFVPDEFLYVVKAMMVLLFILADITWFSSHSVNYVTCTKVLQSERKSLFITNTTIIVIVSVSSGLNVLNCMYRVHHASFNSELFGKY